MYLCRGLFGLIMDLNIHTSGMIPQGNNVVMTRNKEWVNRSVSLTKTNDFTLERMVTNFRLSYN